jgi:predicted short-subunit dehydrogenase-like oxidoreductase (DUF2520 family)
MKPGAKHRVPLRVAIVGAGIVGTVLGRILAEEGARITAVVSRSRSSARRAAGYLKCRRWADALTAIPPETDIVFITTPHDAVAEVASTLARLEGLDFMRTGFCHASGMLTASVLQPLERRGSAVFSFHPLQTFPRSFPPRRVVPRARGIWYGVDGSPRGLRLARALARALCGRIIEIPPESRELYHATCVVASNHLTALLAAVQEMFSGVRGERAPSLVPFRPIIDATLLNVLSTSPASALSGPVARGGVGTVERHLEAVRVHCPALLPYFTRMTLETLRLAVARGSLGPGPREALEKLIMSYAKDSPPRGDRP